MFLSLQMLEVFWYLCVMANTLLFWNWSEEKPVQESLRERLVRERQEMRRADAGK